MRTKININRTKNLKISLCAILIVTIFIVGSFVIHNGYLKKIDVIQNEFLTVQNELNKCEEVLDSTRNELEKSQENHQLEHLLRRMGVTKYPTRPNGWKFPQCIEPRFMEIEPLCIPGRLGRYPRLHVRQADEQLSIHELCQYGFGEQRRTGQPCFPLLSTCRIRWQN